MKADRFDRLSQAIGRATSRRRALAMLVGGAATAAAAPYLATRDADAATTGRSGAAAAASFTCSPSNTPTLSSCQEINAYIQQCGIMCPDGHRQPNADGCTTHDPIKIVWTYRGPVFTRPHFEGWCAQQHVSAEWVVTPHSTVLQPSVPNACCRSGCDAMWREYSAGIDRHEVVHRNRRIQLGLYWTGRWTMRPFAVCSDLYETEGAARTALQARIRATLNGDHEALELDLRTDPEPPLSPRPDCSKCQLPKPAYSCVNGSCVCAGQECRDGGCCGRPGTKCCDNGSGGCCPRGTACCPPNPIGQLGCCPPDFPHCAWDPALGKLQCYSSLAVARLAANGEADRRKVRSVEPVAGSASG